eukprot:gene14815-biopygen9187
MALGCRAPVITETLGKPWKTLVNLGMDWESVWPEARAQPGECLAMGHVKQKQSLGEPWNEPWQIVEDVGETLGNPWEDLGETLDDHW